MFELIKITGYFSYKKYVKHGKIDHKVGPNKFDYLCQIPVFGIIPITIFYVLLYIVIALLFPLHLYQRWSDK